MSTLKKLREELEQIKTEILAKRTSPAKVSTSGFADNNGLNAVHQAIEDQVKELNKLAKTMLDEAETTVSDHPVATVAGAMALGIAIGRLTAR